MIDLQTLIQNTTDNSNSGEAWIILADALEELNDYRADYIRGIGWKVLTYAKGTYVATLRRLYQEHGVHVAEARLAAQIIGYDVPETLPERLKRQAGK